nr:MAG TPA: hypothetical protein [Caudoviricetes sp.]
MLFLLSLKLFFNLFLLSKAKKMLSNSFKV